MKRTATLLLVLSVSAVSAFSQESVHEAKVGRFIEIKAELMRLEIDLVRPADVDFAEARGQGVAVRILPRENYDGWLPMRGGGSYYSFVHNIHPPDEGSDINYSKGRFSVGFSGVDYGFFAELGDVRLQSVQPGLPKIEFLANYKPPFLEAEIREEQKRAVNYSANGYVYANNIPAVVGRTYVLRSINFNKSDILVAFRVVRKDVDGSLILIWKPLKKYERPEIKP